MLKKEAAAQDITTSSLANQIIGNYFDFHIVALSACLMPFSKKLIVAFLDRMNDDDVMEFGRFAAQSQLLEIVYMKRNEFTLDALIESILTCARFSGFSHNVSREKKECWR
jgi:hypothetical protein